MSTVDYPKLKNSEVETIFTAIDANRDGTVSGVELEEIVKNNMVK